MRSYYKAYKKVGKISASLLEELGFATDGYVYASPGVLNHIKKRHGKQLTKKVKNNLIDTMKAIIESPDYVGIDRRSGKNYAFQLVKKIDTTILLGLEVDLEENYIYVSTLYPLTKGKINNKLYSGKLKKYADVNFL
ncbi:MAG: hypothetical protein PUE01_06775 [Clostridiaceae bacterium]|nr:hypothetical protein [Clostridiaceae bacterium]